VPPFLTVREGSSPVPEGSSPAGCQLISWEPGPVPPPARGRAAPGLV